ncbi:MAG TPA: bifunctional phosphoribosyl-AMP cyclohydrolase/phosphoribosyl-ATP diphosphatase HisIE [Candidatus Avichristensenella intestinipullorum]|uniref:Histidine biosynthesis bifunctional protein HisIE n=1 Tax=Candidatus Avichristensenella intestinipullorum TaxID=2840693 RepID=A0A9D0YVR0_9FIRM|nr:bifunctional phosphoribosyl-AMP cyclohydrolase/phosphoribosyl-ATP diphosphatase HisIE [Candidatus Avichristensenella intestinipullorum]
MKSDGEWMDTLKFGPDGLIPAVVQDFSTGRVLTVAYMNRESLDISLREGRTCFYSRSRRTLWRKGETSGNTQRIARITADCDGDALLVEVLPAGPACHTGAESCFFRPLWSDDTAQRFSMDDLYALLKGRRDTPREGSYTSYLFAKGKEKILKKVGEECTETIIGAMKDSREETVYEIADLAYHVLVLMVEMGLTPDDIRRELASRHVVDHKVKQETMR